MPVIVVQPTRGWSGLDLGAFWRYRELFYFLIWRDLKVRYKQTALGAAWAILQPLSTMIIFSLFFGRLAGLQVPGVPYPLFAYAGLLPWQFFAYALTNASTSLVVNERIVTKVYFPRILVPTAAVVAGAVDFALACPILAGMMLFYGVVPSWQIMFLPLFLVLVFGTALGVSLWLSALDVQYRDVRYTLPFLTQLWLFATPVVYPSSILPEPWRSLYGLNPMAGAIEGFRWAVLGLDYTPGPLLAVSVCAMFLVLITGAFYFRQTERALADIV
jgi:lipopolysaccharide transport system permease protein